MSNGMANGDVAREIGHDIMRNRQIQHPASPKCQVLEAAHWNILISNAPKVVLAKVVLMALPGASEDLQAHLPEA